MAQLSVKIMRLTGSVLGENQQRGEMEFARCLGAAPSLVAAFEKLKGEGRG